MGKLNLKLEKIIKMKLAATLVVLADNNTTTNDNNIARAQKWVTKVFDQAAQIDTTFPCPEDEEADQALVFDQEDFCKLNGQVATALRSFVRKYGCDGSFPKKNFPNTFAKRTR